MLADLLSCSIALLQSRTGAEFQAFAREKEFNALRSDFRTIARVFSLTCAARSSLLAAVKLDANQARVIFLVGGAGNGVSGEHPRLPA
jgi:hypothetical protein